MNNRSFSSRLTWRIIVIVSIIFYASFIVIGLVSQYVLNNESPKAAPLVLALSLILVGVVGLVVIYFICRKEIRRMTRPVTELSVSALNMAKGKSAHEAYTRGVINAILTSRYNRIRITADGERIARGPMVLCTVANGRRVGGEFNCAPNAVVDDGLMDVCYFRAMSLLRLLMLIPLYRSGEHIGSRPGKNRVLYRHAREVVISSKDLIDIYLDGEQLPGSQFIQVAC